MVVDSTNITSLELKHIAKSFSQADAHIPVLNGAELQLERGELVAIVGASGSGKSTLLHIAGTLDRADSGSVCLHSQEAHIDISGLPDEKLKQIRNNVFGFVFQFHHLLGEFTALENVALPALVRGTRKEDAMRAAAELLQRVHVDHRADAFPDTLSGGESQRVAIARALVNQPAFVLADEPTGNLDAANAASVMQLLREVAQEFSTGFLIVTHSSNVARECDRILHIEQGVLHQSS